jgi:FMN phosphatase YigB (HAD superfamily)
MPITLLLDLDDTLLDTNMDAFVPAYFKALGGALGHLVDPQKMIQALMDGTHAMMRNTDPAVRLNEAFDRVFFPALGMERAQLQPVIDRFYDEGFPKIQNVTRPRPQAIELIEWAFAQGHRVVIATNPLFPRKAILHRLRWAGLAPEKYPFAYIPGYETMRFAKTVPAYYPEILGLIGWPDDPFVFVSDDTQMDIPSSVAAGVPTFWIQNGKTDLPAGLTVQGRGEIGDLRAWLEAADPSTLKPAPVTPVSLVSMLRAAPAALAGLLDPVPPDCQKRSPRPGEWCAVEVICHLRDVDREVNLPRFQQLLSEDRPFLGAQDTDAWAIERGYARQDGARALQDFITARKLLIDLLAPLSADDWKRPARHAIFGPTDLQELVSFITEHDRIHIHQAWEAIEQARAQKV